MLLLRIPAHLQIAGAGFKIAPPAFIGLGRGLFLARLQIGQVGKAKRAADRVQVKVNVLAFLAVERLEQITPQLIAARTGQALASPNRADGVFAAVALLDERAEQPAQGVGFAEGGFDLGGFIVIEGVVEVGVEKLAGDVGLDGRRGSGSCRVEPFN
jgi:hypothetical protein